MLFVAVALADDPWMTATLLDERKRFRGQMPIPDAAALVTTTWDSLRHIKQDIADDGQPGFLARTEAARTLVLRAGADVLSIDGDDASEVGNVLTLYRALGVAGCPAMMLVSGRVPEIPNPTHGVVIPLGSTSGPGDSPRTRWSTSSAEQRNSASGARRICEPRGPPIRAARRCRPSMIPRIGSTG